MNSIQLITARNFILFLTFIAFSIQLFLINNINDFYCLTLLIFSNVITTFYCFNKKYFFDAPITLMIIFFSNFINLGGVLYLKSFEISVITLNLNYPLSTILNLTIFNFIIIFSHLIYIKSDFKNKLRNKFTSLFIRLNLFEFNNFTSSTAGGLTMSTRNGNNTFRNNTITGGTGSDDDGMQMSNNPVGNYFVNNTILCSLECLCIFSIKTFIYIHVVFLR